MYSEDEIIEEKQRSSLDGCNKLQMYSPNTGCTSDQELDEIDLLDGSSLDNSIKNKEVRLEEFDQFS